MHIYQLSLIKTHNNFSFIPSTITTNILLRTEINQNKILLKLRYNTEWYTLKKYVLLSVYYVQCNVGQVVACKLSFITRQFAYLLLYTLR